LVPLKLKSLVLPAMLEPADGRIPDSALLYRRSSDTQRQNAGGNQLPGGIIPRLTQQRAIAAVLSISGRCARRDDVANHRKPDILSSQPVSRYFQVIDSISCFFQPWRRWRYSATCGPPVGPVTARTRVFPAGGPSIAWRMMNNRHIAPETHFRTTPPCGIVQSNLCWKGLNAAFSDVSRRLIAGGLIPEFSYRRIIGNSLESNLRHCEELVFGQADVAIWLPQADRLH
jgi:hypothetical protein